MNTELKPADPNFRKRMAGSFRRQGFLHHMGVKMVELEPGYCVMEVPFSDQLSQQHGYFHGGAVATLADVAAGYAAFSLTRPDVSMVTVEMKLNFLAAAAGERLVARGSVIKAGKTLTVCRCDVACLEDGKETLCATALATFIALAGKPEKSV